MYTFLTYHIADIPDNQIRKFDKKVSSVLNRYNKVQVFDRTFIIRINGQTDWDNIYNQLKSIAELCGCDFKFVLSPATVGGGYNGWLPKEMWGKIRKITS